MKGHGTVVTGTVISGQCNLGDELRFMPADLPTRARGLQRHGAAADSVQPGQRCAVNVQGLDVDEIERGYVLARPGELFPPTAGWCGLPAFHPPHGPCASG